MSLNLNSIVPSYWEHDFRSKEVHCTTLRPYSSDYVEIADELDDAIPECKISSIEQIENSFLWGCYLLKKKEYTKRGIDFKEKTLLHCTSKDNISSIISDNLDWRLSTRVMFGNGVSFSGSAYYAHKHANRRIGSSRAMIVALVLVGNSTSGNSDIIIPDSIYDTTTGNSGLVYVKYCDYEFYPKFVVYYTGKVPSNW